ncbi:MAG: hypothetical protein V2A54_05870 [Bacteroidota bacterium]
MKRYLLIIFIGLVIKGYSQNPFTNIDFNEGGYSLLVVNDREPVFGWKRDSIGRLLKIDSTTHFFTSEKPLLNKVKSKWNLIPTNEFSLCGYDYILYLIKEDSLIFTFKYNIDCADFISKSSFFKLKPEMFFSVISYFDKFERKESDYNEFRKSQKEFEKTKFEFSHYFERNFMKKISE